MVENQGNWSDIGIGKGRQILVVDAAEDVRLTLTLGLKREGYQVSSARSALEALQIIKSQGIPDLILLDIMLPRMDGFALAYEIRKRSNVPIVVVSSITDVDTRVEALIEFAEDYLTKPFHLEELVVRIWRILTHYPPRETEILGDDEEISMGCMRGRVRPWSGHLSTSTTHRRSEKRLPCAPIQSNYRVESAHT